MDIKPNVGKASFAIALGAAVLAAGAAPAAVDLDNPVPVDISIIDLGGGKGYGYQNTYAAPFYTYDRDEPNKSNCIDKCAEIWVPVYPTQNNAASIGTTWTLITRSDGYKQWAYKGKPLYTFGFGEHEPPTKADLKSEWHQLAP